MPHPLQRQIRQTLWAELRPGYKVWTILDGARDDRVYPTYLGTYLDKSCLYAGALPPELQVTAPYLVELDRDDRTTRSLIDYGWGNSWGIFLRSDAGLEKLRRHLRTFLRVRDERGKTLIFRYYDPRVWRLYLPTCSPGELRQVFGPVESYVVENDDGSGAIEFRLEQNRLQRRDLRLGEGTADESKIFATRGRDLSSE